MDEALRVVVEMNESTWNGFKRDLEDVTPEEADWRPLPQANSINLIVRHLRLEAEWHTASLEKGAPMPYDVTPGLQQQIDSVPLDFERNSKELEGQYTRFLSALGGATLPALQRQTELAYGAWASAGGPPIPPHFLGYHQAMHLAMHWGQIRTIRNLYQKTRGEPARFHPKNPTYPS